MAGDDCLRPEVSGMTGYRAGCRCERCRAAAAEKKRAWRRRGGPGVEQDRAASRRWKREHPEEADRHNWWVCACGRRMRHGAPHCLVCRREAERAARDARWAQIARLWAAGATLKEIAASLDSTVGSIQVSVARMRADGWSVPYRRPRKAD